MATPVFAHILFFIMPNAIFAQSKLKFPVVSAWKALSLSLAPALYDRSTDEFSAYIIITVVRHRKMKLIESKSIA